MIPAWKRNTFKERALDCATFLVIHGLLSAGERAKVFNRLTKMVKRQRATTTTTEAK
jgi:hypothetical protein